MQRKRLENHGLTKAIRGLLSLLLSLEKKLKRFQMSSELIFKFTMIKRSPNTKIMKR